MYFVICTRRQFLYDLSNSVNIVYGFKFFCYCISWQEDLKTLSDGGWGDTYHIGIFLTGEYGFHVEGRKGTIRKSLH